MSNFKYEVIEVFPHQFTLALLNDHNDELTLRIIDWCDENLTFHTHRIDYEERYENGYEDVYTVLTVNIKEEKEAMLFKLTWAGVS